MRCRRGIHTASSAQFVTVVLDLSRPSYTWLSTIPVIGDDRERLSILPDVWHGGPLQSAHNALTADIIKHIQSDLQCWLDGNVTHPVQMPSWLSLDETHSINLEEACISPASRNILSLRLILDYVVQNRHYSEKPFHAINWVSGSCSALEYPIPYFELSQDCPSHQDIAAIIGITRHEGPYEGGTDYLLQRRIKTAISLLFSSFDVDYIPGTDCLDAPNSGPSDRCPLLIAGGCSELTETVRSKMAASAQRTLELMFKLRDPTSASLPKYFFIYGLHWSTTVFSIFVHFPSHIPPTDTATTRPAEFRQFLVVQHRLIPEVSASQGEAQDDRFFDRWRLLVALFSVRSHVRKLHEWLNDTQKIYPNFPADMRGSAEQSRRVLQGRPSQRLLLYLTGVRDNWRANRFPVPETWIPADASVIVATHVSDWDNDLVVLETRQLASIHIYPLRGTFIPLSKDALRSRHLDEDNLGPDFIHRVHTPRIDALPEWLDVEDHLEDTAPHLNRLYDLLVMSTLGWPDVNLFIASAFSSFSEYSVQWNPKVRYPYAMIDYPQHGMIVDFALAMQKIPASTERTIERAPFLPLTASTPAILLGFRSSNLNEDGSHVSEEELRKLTLVMAPHLQLLAMFLCFCATRGRKFNGIPSWATLFCTYLKAGYVHILAFSPDDCSPGFRTITTHVDCLPIARQCRDNEDLQDRVRLAMALFTLQRHIIRVCTHWDDTMWARDGLTEEHEAIVQATGISTEDVSNRVVPVEGDTMRKRKIVKRLLARGLIEDIDAEYVNILPSSDSEDSSASAEYDEENTYDISDTRISKKEKKLLKKRVMDWRMKCGVASGDEEH
ncbi:unnamed protein product [Somion occarium]|uniref:Uncharacterized protein n=1 Tax=Somion occarium TaxID=3059160 RepID=A0ABP1DEV0_9APHY